ncbi:MAG: NAD(P)-binding domain-containing protein [Actinomycetota bacterium]
MSSRTVTCVVVGAGQAGLASSACLAVRSIDHVVLERGEVAHSWRTERWDSLRLLTPNWMTRLPGGGYTGPDPDGYMTAVETARFLDRYRATIAAPVECGVSVQRITTSDEGRFEVETDAGVWRARSVVIATGACSDPHVPAVAEAFRPGTRHLTPIAYRNPDQIESGRVLVVGASASGAQIADELARHGHDVTVAVGNHVRLPRTYRGMDIHWWMDRVGVLDERLNDVDDVERVRRTPSLQLVGSSERRSIDLNALSAAGVNVTGRLAHANDTHAQFSGSLANMLRSADLKMNRLLDQIDEFASSTGLADEIAPDDRPGATDVPAAPLQLRLDDVGTVVWATGFRPRYPFLPDQWLDSRGRLVHDQGILPVPGAYVIGLPFLRRRASGFIDRVGVDAHELCDHLLSSTLASV